MADVPVALREQQFALARHLRDPRAAPAPAGIEERRLAIYRDLLYNNMQSLLAGNFPVIRATLAEPDWNALVRVFYAGHRCHTPLFTEIGREFVRWLDAQESTAAALPPWLAELAHYEWVELALQISDAAPDPGVIGIRPGQPDAMQMLLDGVPVVSPQAWPLAYRWPVYRIGPDYQPGVAPEQPTLLLAHRGADGEVAFATLSPPAFRLLELLSQGDRCGRDCLLAVATEAGADPNVFLAEGGALLLQMLAAGTLCGIRQI